MTIPAAKTTAPPAKLEQKKYVVAFLDFLGASEKMKSEEDSDDFLQKINSLFNMTLEQKDFANKNKIINVSDLKIKIFSDNIVIACEILQKYIPAECYTISMFCSMLQEHALFYGLLVRGAITMGSFYIDDRFVFGEALVRAYNLESTIAVYPRIIMSDEVAEIVASPDSTEKDDNLAIQDSDGIWFVNFMYSYVLGVARQNPIVYLVSIRGRILDFFDSRAIVVPVEKRQKYNWLAVKFNELCESSGYKEQKIAFDGLTGPKVTHFYEDEYEPVIEDDLANNKT